MANDELKIIQHLDLDNNEIRNAVIPRLNPPGGKPPGIFGINTNNRLYYTIAAGGTTIPVELAKLVKASGELMINLNYTANGTQSISFNLAALRAALINDALTSTAATWSSREIIERINTAIANAEFGGSEILNTMVELFKDLTIGTADISTIPIPSEFPLFPTQYLQLSPGRITLYELVSTDGPNPEDPPIISWEIKEDVILGNSRYTHTVTAGTADPVNIPWTPELTALYGDYPMVQVLLEVAGGEESTTALVKYNRTAGELTSLDITMDGLAGTVIIM